MKTANDLVNDDVYYQVSRLISAISELDFGQDERLSTEAKQLISQAIGLDQPLGAGDEEQVVFEHWVVSPWLADLLTQEGAKVDHDFGGLRVWARTTTGQPLHQDSVFRDICRKLNQNVV